MKDEANLKEMISIQKKKEKISIRNDQLIVEDDESNNQVFKAEKYGTIRYLLMGPLGVILWGAFFGYAFLFVYKKVFKLGLNRISEKQE